MATNPLHLWERVKSGPLTLTAYTPDSHSATGGGPWQPLPARRQLLTYRTPVFAGNAASFYGLTIPVSMGLRAIVGVPIWASTCKDFKTTITTTYQETVKVKQKKKKKRKKKKAKTKTVTKTRTREETD